MLSEVEKIKSEIKAGNFLRDDFFIRNTAVVARELPGKIFVKISGDDILAARICETEAYMGKGDMACHSAPGLTERNRPMFEKGGIMYVYLIYGVHRCFNFVCGPEGIGTAVLIRAGEVLCGKETISRNRGLNTGTNLLSGPGNFAKGFGIDRKDNYKKLTGNEFYILDGYIRDGERIFRSKRTGIKKSADMPLRFYLSANPCVSKGDLGEEFIQN